MEHWLSFARTRRAGVAGSRIIVVLALLAHPAAAASFDCAKASSRIEKMICADAELSKLDETLGELYAQARAQAADPKALKSAQRTWLRDTRDACADAACMKAAYEARIGALAKTGAATAADTIYDTDLYTSGRPPGMYSLSENNDPRVCSPLFQSLNSLWDAKRQRGPHILMRNDYLIQPWEPRKYLWRLRVADEPKTHHLEVAFLDLNRDGKEEAMFRQTGAVRGNEFQVAFLVLSADSAIKENNPLQEELVREIFQTSYVDFANFDKPPHDNRQFIELVELNNKIYVLIGRAFYWTLDDNPRKPKVQLLRLNGSQLERVCLFEGTREIVKRRLDE